MNTTGSLTVTGLQPTLSAAAYNDPLWFERERDAIFWREWFCVGRAEQLQQAGDFLELSVIGERILLVRAR